MNCACKVKKKTIFKGKKSQEKSQKLIIFYKNEQYITPFLT